MRRAALAPNVADTDGRHDFDFPYRSWRVSSRKLRDPLDADNDAVWLELAATADAGPLLGGLGSYDANSVP